MLRTEAGRVDRGPGVDRLVGGSRVTRLVKRHSKCADGAQQNLANVRRAIAMFIENNRAIHARMIRL